MDSTTMSHACVNCGHNTRSNTIAVPVSPVPHLLNTNYSPSQTEVGLIRTSISQVHADIAEIDYELASLQAATAQIQRKRRLLLSFSEGHKSLLSPVRRIAPETLSDIFMWCLMEFWEDLFASCDYTRICLSHVCRFWRDVALSTPKMWAWIGLAMKSEHEQSQVAMTKTWLT
jgi:F-box-like